MPPYDEIVDDISAVMADQLTPDPLPLFDPDTIPSKAWNASKSGWAKDYDAMLESVRQKRSEYEHLEAQNAERSGSRNWTLGALRSRWADRIQPAN